MRNESNDKNVIINSHQVFLKCERTQGMNAISTSASVCKGTDICIAMMGPPCCTDKLPSTSIIARWQAPYRTAPHRSPEPSLLLYLTHAIVPAAKYILCETTFDEDGIFVDCGVTAAAVRWLTNSWEKWKKEHNLQRLIVCIPYGGKYRFDEDDAIHMASALGIVFVCAAGSRPGLVFPAKLADVISVGTTPAHHEDFEAHGRELDFVASGRTQIGDCFLTGSAVSAAIATGQIAQVMEYLHKSLNPEHRAYVCTPVLKELLQSRASSSHTSYKGFGPLNSLTKSFCNAPSESTTNKLVDIVLRRDRRPSLYSPISLNDAKANSEIWSSDSINGRNKRQNKEFPVLTGKGVTVALIDKFSDEYLTHLREQNSLRHAGGIFFFKKRAADIIKRDAAFISSNHVLQCAAIIANTAPNCNLLVIYGCIKNGEKAVLNIAEQDMSDIVKKREKAALNIAEQDMSDIVLLCGVTVDTWDKDYWTNVRPLLEQAVVFSAAGNEGKNDRNSICYPSRAGDIITVGACDQHGNRCSYSSVGRELDFLCPGQFHIADPKGMGGTCYSVAAAAGFTALLLEFIDLKLPDAMVPVCVPAVGTKMFRWIEKKVPLLARNTRVMRELLCSRELALCQRNEHNTEEGYGQLLIDNLVTLAPEAIECEIKRFFSVAC